MFEFLVWNEAGFVVTLGVWMESGTLQRLHMLDRHSKYCQLIKLSWHGTAHRHHSRQLSNVRVHLVATTFLNLTMILPEDIFWIKIWINNSISLSKLLPSNFFFKCLFSFWIFYKHFKVQPLNKIQCKKITLQISKSELIFLKN